MYLMRSLPDSATRSEPERVLCEVGAGFSIKHLHGNGVAQGKRKKLFYHVADTRF